MSMLEGTKVDTATVWRIDGVNSVGEPQFSTPTQISVRWLDRMELFFDSNGNEVRSRSVIFSDDEVKEGDYLFRGESAETNPTALSQAYPARGVNVAKSLSGDEQFYKVML